MPTEGEWGLFPSANGYEIRSHRDGKLIFGIGDDIELARRIVTAVNCHQELVGLVEDYRLVTQIERDSFACKCLFEEPSPSHAEVVRKYNERLNRIDVVLAKARGES